MTHSALPASIRERLLNEAVHRHELSARALPEIQDLLQHGLSFEQALVGTGLMSAQAFLDWMQSASGLPGLTIGTERALPPGLELDTLLAWGVVPQKGTKNQWKIGLTNPWDQDIRSALEALAVEHGWSLEFAYVVPSVADEWLRSMDEARHASAALHRYARGLVERVQRDKAHTLLQRGQTIRLKDKASQVAEAWLPALHLHLTRRAEGTKINVRHHRHQHHAKIELKAEQPAPTYQATEEHPVRDWSKSVQAYFDQGKLVFVLDQPGDLLEPWSDLHVTSESEDWRAGKRWVAEPTIDNQEELFHFALAGYPGTVRFTSTRELSAWERAAEAAGVPYAACIGLLTDHGPAWSLYSL